VNLSIRQHGEYGRLADRIDVVLAGPGSRYLDVDLLTLGRTWAYGLRQLDEASELAGYASRLATEHMRRNHTDGPVTDPGYRQAIEAQRATEISETYHTLALIALAQPVWESIAVTFLSYPMGLPPRPTRKRHDPWWPGFVNMLDASSDPELSQLKAEARATDVTMVLARDRLVAHPLANRVAFTSRAATGQITGRGRIQWDENAHTENADIQLRKINEQLAVEHRSTETNRWKLADDLARNGASMARPTRESFKSASRDLGLSFHFEEAAQRLVALIEAIASWSAARS
jgi:hypothetical protein